MPTSDCHEFIVPVHGGSRAGFPREINISINIIIRAVKLRRLWGLRRLCVVVARDRTVI